VSQKIVVNERISESVRGVPEGIGMRDEGQFRELGRTDPSDLTDLADRTCESG